MNILNAFTIAIPTIAVLFGILLNRQDATAIRAEMKAESAQLRNEMGQIRNEMGQMRAEMIQLRNTIHADMVGVHERIAVVESKQND